MTLLGRLLWKEDHNNELDEPQISTIQNKLLRSTRDGTDAVINYVGFSINPKLLSIYEHVRTVGEIIIKKKNISTGMFRCDYYVKE